MPWIKVLIRNLKANSLFCKHRLIYMIVHLVFWTLSQQHLFKERVSACLFVLFILTACFTLFTFLMFMFRCPRFTFSSARRPSWPFFLFSLASSPCSVLLQCKSNGSLNLKTGCAAVGSNNCNQAFVITDAVTQLQLHASFTCLFHCEEVSADPEQ